VPIPATPGVNQPAGCSPATSSSCIRAAFRSPRAGGGYAAAAVGATGCDPTACDPHGSAFGLPLYPADELPGEVLSLGCGNPVAVADLRPGETVLDLGSGAGLDPVLSARRVGPTGRVIGLDMTPEMVELARRNTAATGVDNIEVLLGPIERIPLPSASVDVVISNCVLNLAADKGAVLREVARVLRPGGRLGVSDLLADETADSLDVAASAAAVGTGVRPLTEIGYRRLLDEAGLTDVQIRRSHVAAPGISAGIVGATKPSWALLMNRPPPTCAATGRGRPDWRRRRGSRCGRRGG
jgi:arsenite methyltransferase